MGNPPRTGRRLRGHAAASASAPATGWPATCPTCPRRSSPSSGRRPSARCGPPAPRTSAPAPSSTGSPRSSPRCWWRPTATASTARTTTAGTSSPSCGSRCRPCGRPSSSPGCSPPRCPTVPCPGPRPSPTSRSRSSRRCPSTTRCGSSTRRGRPDCPRGSCTGTAASFSSSASKPRCTWTPASGTGSSGTPPPPGSCNIATSALLSGATVVVYDGAPTYPSVDALFGLAARTGITYFGTSPGYLGACEKAGERPGERHDPSAVRSIGVTGSPLPSSTFRWVYDAVKGDVFLGSLSAARTWPPVSSAARCSCRRWASCSGRCSASPPRPGTRRANRSSASWASW